MNNVGFNYGMMGLRNLDRLGDVENRRIWDQYETSAKESEAKNEAIGTLIGTAAGAGLAGYKEYTKDSPMDNPPGGEQAIGKAAKASVSANQVLGENSVIAEKDDSTLEQKMDNYAGNGLGAASIKDSYEQNAMPDILKDRPMVFAKTPTRILLSSSYNQTSDGFKQALNGVMNGWGAFIGGTP
jgi:hypothetical protein